MAIIVKGGGGKPEEEKTVTAGTSAIVVNPSSGKVMKKVTVNPTPTESKEVTAGTEDTTVSPTDGKHLSGVIVHPTPSQEKTVIPTADGFKVSPETGKLLSAVFVDGDIDLVAGNIKQGVNIFGVDGSFDNSHGAYVWSKSEVMQPEISYTNPAISVKTVQSGKNITITSSEIDFTKIPTADLKNFFNGFTNGTQYFYLSGSVLVFQINSGYYQSIESITVNSANSVTMVMSSGFDGYGTTYTLSYSGKKTVQELSVNTIGFVVSNDSSDYPSAGEHTDGYYYELIGSVSSTNIMSLSDNALMTVQQDYRNTIETEVSNANA